VTQPSHTTLNLFLLLQDTNLIRGWTRLLTYNLQCRAGIEDRERATESSEVYTQARSVARSQNNYSSRVVLKFQRWHTWEFPPPLFEPASIKSRRTTHKAITRPFFLHEIVYYRTDLTSLFRTSKLLFTTKNGKVKTEEYGKTCFSILNSEKHISHENFKLTLTGEARYVAICLCQWPGVKLAVIKCNTPPLASPLATGLRQANIEKFSSH